MEEVKNATKKYVEAVKTYKDFVGEFLVISWEGEEVNEPKKVLNKEGLEKIKKLRKEMDVAHKEWLSLIRKGI